MQHYERERVARVFDQEVYILSMHPYLSITYWQNKHDCISLVFLCSLEVTMNKIKLKTFSLIEFLNLYPIKVGEEKYQCTLVEIPV